MEVDLPNGVDSTSMVVIAIKCFFGSHTPCAVEPYGTGKNTRLTVKFAVRIYFVVHEAAGLLNKNIYRLQSRGEFCDGI